VGDRSCPQRYGHPVRQAHGFRWHPENGGISGLLLVETGVTHNKQRLHKVKYFRELMSGNNEITESIRPPLQLRRDTIVRLQKTGYALVSSLQLDPLLVERIKRLMTVPGVGSHYGVDLGLGDGRCVELPVGEAGDQLLRPLRGGKDLRRQGHAHATF
jgi:hypothetical protein